MGPSRSRRGQGEPGKAPAVAKLQFSVQKARDKREKPSSFSEEPSAAKVAKLSSPNRPSVSALDGQVPTSPLAAPLPLGLRSPLSPRNGSKTPLSPPKKGIASLLASCRRALHTSQPDKLHCRDQEKMEIEEFLERHVEQRKGGSLYISGQPGTGKTATVKHLLAQDKWRTSGVRQVFVSSMRSCSTPKHIYGALARETQCASKLKKNPEVALERHFTSPGPMIVMVIDELDQLSVRSQEVLYTLFEWPSLPSSRLVFIGIANALDFIDRTLPRLLLRSAIRPQTLTFAAYTAKEIETILTCRLEEAESLTSVDPSAIRLVSRKVQSSTGDLRRALDVFRVSIRDMDAKTFKRKLSFGASSGQGPRDTSGTPTSDRVGVAQVMRALAQMDDQWGHTKVKVGGEESGSDAPALPLHQMLIVCTLLLLSKSKKKVVSISKAYEVYAKICDKRAISRQDVCQFQQLCDSLQARSVVSVKKPAGKRPEVSLTKSEQQLEHLLKGYHSILASILSEGLQ